MAAENILECTNVSKTFGATRALDAVQLIVKKGDVHCILGENGAGKSTLIKILCGVHRPDKGSVIRLNGEEVSFHDAKDAADHGIVAVFQELSIIGGLSVAENLFLGIEPRKKNGLIDYRKLNEEAQRIMDYVGLENVHPEVKAKQYSLAQRQLMEVCKALAKHPQVVIFDEATSALSNKEVDLLFALIRKLKSEGVTSLFISHRMSEIAQICDSGSVYRDSHYIASFIQSEVEEAQLLNWIVGREVKDVYPPRNVVKEKKTALRIEHLSGPKLKDICLEIYRGEIFGIAGLQGHGQRDFLYTLFGAMRASGGEAFIEGKPMKMHDIGKSIEEGLVLVPEERKIDGLMLNRSVNENMMLMTLKKRAKASFISTKKESEAYGRMSSMMNLKAADPGIEVESLSGGNQQKVVIAKALLTDAPIILLADPTRGIDIGAKAEIYKIINQLAAEGKTVLLYSTEMSELVYLANRIAVFKQGEVVALLEEEEISEFNIISNALGAGQKGEEEA